jgi:hypothetical protein
LSADYEYDVFLSYKRHELTLNWTRKVASMLVLWLTEELNRPARVFIDESSIQIGQKWPDEIKHALKHSRCIVCIWSPSYFQSSWCVSEWKSFVDREKMGNPKPYTLIAPLRFHDGEHFPEEAKGVEWSDVTEYAFTMPAFWDSQRAIELEAKLKAFARSVANIVSQAPAFDGNWPIVERDGSPAPSIPLAKL